MILSINKAAKAAGCSRSTIQRKIAAGQLSATRQPDGSQGIETSELFRVFGEPEGTVQARPMGQPDTPEWAADGLQARIEDLRQELEAAKGREVWYQNREVWYQNRIEALEGRLLPAPGPAKRAWGGLGEWLVRRRGA